MGNRRLPYKQIERLENARKSATLENASFGFPKDTVISNGFCEMSGIKMHPTEYIRKKVDLHHRTWIISEIDAVLAWAKGEGQE
jgi:hypothetical protein